MEHRIEVLEEIKITGISMSMSLADNRIGLLWSAFMRSRGTIQNRVSPYYYSIQVYGSDFDFQNVNMERPFIKWAGVEVDNTAAVPENMDSFILPGGLYAVFLHKGPARTTPSTFRYIFGTWLPASEYKLDNRPHFEKLGEKYSNDSDDSEEEIWIPVTVKSVT